jgi:glycopeptide antibiotics resistance protein
MLTTDGYLTLIPGYWFVVAALPVGWWIWRRPTGSRRKALELLAWLHLTVVIALTIFPIPIAGQDYYRITRGFSEDNFIPFATIAVQLHRVGLYSVKQLGGNVVLLAPFGVYGPMLWARLRDWRWFVVAAIAFGVSIELTQLAGSLLEGFTYRVTDVDDAMMNASGAVATFFVWRWAEPREPLRGWLARLGVASGAEPAGGPEPAGSAR